jgi:hydrogenase maturation factor HypF (carbamoyltransferase family)
MENFDTEYNKIVRYGLIPVSKCVKCGHRITVSARLPKSIHKKILLIDFKLPCKVCHNRKKILSYVRGKIQY